MRRKGRGNEKLSIRKREVEVEGAIIEEKVGVVKVGMKEESSAEGLIDRIGG